MLFSFDESKLPKVANPEHAERTIERWVANAPNTNFSKAVVDSSANLKLFRAIAGNSPFLAQCLQRDAAFTSTLLQRGPNDIFDEIIASLRALMDTKFDSVKLMATLREAKRNAALTIAVGDISGVWDVDKVMDALSTFADESISTATRYVLRHHANAGRIPDLNKEDPEKECGFVILGLGKLGARELNYSSDVDLIVLYDPHRIGLRDRDALSAAYIRATRDLVKILEDRTADGYVHRIDLRLRPDPGTTPIAISTIAAETYYESVGQNWERMAMIRARPIAGDKRLGQEFLHHLRPFVWRKNLDFAAIQDIHSVKRQINTHRNNSPTVINGHNIKLGRGGIREIEFFVQTQQLIWGGRSPELRGRELAKALQALVGHGRLDDASANELQEAYRFLRRIEHRLQMVDDKQTHEIPKASEKIEEIAIFSGFDTLDKFRDALLEQLKTVEWHYANLFEGSDDLGGEGSLVFTGNELHPDTQTTLKRMGYKDPSKIFNIVRIWHHGRYRSTRSERSRQLLTEIMPRLLEALADTANPDFAFSRFDEFLGRLPAGVSLLSLLHANPNLLDLVAMVMGNAPTLAEWLSRTPHLLDYVLSDEFNQPTKDRPTMRNDLTEELRQAGHYEQVLDFARRWTNDQKFRIGIQVLRGTTDAVAAGPALTAIAETVIDVLCPYVEEEFAIRHGRIEGAGMCAVAYGKLGGREMMHGSDLDIVFVYDHSDNLIHSNGEKPLAPSDYFMRLAQRIVSAIRSPTSEGKLYEVDLRLRPSGNKGPLAVRADGYLDYLENSAWTWEHMALTRARPISGPSSLRQRIGDGIAKVLSRDRNSFELLTDVRQMRQRIAASFHGKSLWDIKHRAGGLVDIEFLCQYLQLKNRSTFSTTTATALRDLADTGCINREKADELLNALRLWISLQSIIRLIGPENLKDDKLPAGQRDALCRVTGVESFEMLCTEICRHANNVRRVFEQLIGSTASDKAAVIKKIGDSPSNSESAIIKGYTS